MSDRTPEKRIIVGITGASGALYAQRLIQVLCDGRAEVHLIATPNGRRLLHEELGITSVSAQTLIGRDCKHLLIHNYHDVGAGIASGSFRTDGMVVCPCSVNTLASIATGLGDNLLNRAASVTLKEARRLIVVPREMPLTRIDLLNALRLQEAGGVICPASPGFYMGPENIGDLVDFVVGKLLDLIEIPHTLETRWADRLSALDQHKSDELKV